MKFNKLVKTIDYVTYPSLQELRNINRNLGDTITKLTDIIVSAIVAVAIDKTDIIQLAVKSLGKKSKIAFLREIANNISPYISIEMAGTIIAILIGILICIIVRATRWFYVRFMYKNKSKISQRERIFRDFYKLAIPQLVTIKSLLEQHDESDASDTNKRFLLLLQVKYEICDLIGTLNELKVLEEKKDGTLHKNSRYVLDLIGSDAYYAVLEELTRCASTTMNHLRAYNDKADDLVESINSNVIGSKALIMAREKNSKFEEVFLNYFEKEGQK